MSVRTFADATLFQRVQMIEAALEIVLNRGPEMSVESFGNGEPMHVFVMNQSFSPFERTAYDLHQIARELEALLP
ncbi:hypothetical protein F8A10_12075 [Paracoccus kondratievae]|uniref:hypothetical protein n=1 Tax=Paracoccus kondratievae TaxID=135740 RepID=UPI001266801D|nr:hypothetical protein [Paracoccus kondratievae]QFQ88247.1 hypothetical protein F8A10_12075 [Paracoccus kondratievae]